MRARPFLSDFSLVLLGVVAYAVPRVRLATQSV